LQRKPLLSVPLQSIILNACNDFSEVSVFNYDGGEIGLIAILATDVLFDPRGGRGRQRFEKENATVAFNEEVRRDFPRMRGRIA